MASTWRAAVAARRLPCIVRPSVASRETVYEQFGRAAQTAQLLETDIGTALLALDALETKSYFNPSADAYLRLRSEIDGQTLGRSMRRIRERLALNEDIESQFAHALEIRNTLIHRFYVKHGLAFLEPEGRDTMLAQLKDISAALDRAHFSAQNIAGLLVNAVLVLGGPKNAPAKA